MSHHAQLVSEETVPLERESEECCEECVCSPRLFHVLCVTCTEHALNALYECETWEEGGELGCSVVGWLYSLLPCTYTVLVCVTRRACGGDHEYCATLPLVLHVDEGSVIER